MLTNNTNLTKKTTQINRKYLSQEIIKVKEPLKQDIIPSNLKEKILNIVASSNK